jgi:putative ABC transport system permease protein
VAVALSAASGLTALLSILSLLPAHAMRPRAPKGGRRVLLERIGPLWKALSWGSRYAVKNALRNKGRFFAVVLGMCGSCALLVFSLGFYDSIGNTQDEYFDGFANYDAIISFDPLPLQMEHPSMTQVDTGYKALVMPVKVRGENYALAVAEKGFDMVNIPSAELENGVIIPEYFARQWNVEAGDTLEIEDYSVRISAVTPQYLGLTLYTGYGYMDEAAKGLPPAYNTVYARSGDMHGLTEYLKDNGIDFSTLADDATSFDSIMESMTVLIWFMLGCSVVLGFTVLYSVGLINLSAREYEYMFMSVMGYPHGSIMAAHIKETLAQLILAVPVGFLAGNLLLDNIKDEFSGSNFVISASVFPQSYVIAALIVICVTALMSLVTSRHVSGLDIVEGLKVQEE